MGIIHDDLVRPLVLDIQAFKRRYQSLVGLTSYERSNKIALESKRSKWAAYRPLDKDQLYDSLDPIMTTILSPYTNGSSKRSTKGGVMYSQATVVYRPTEHMAIAHALGLIKFASDDPVIRQDPNKVVRWCISCGSFKTLDMFAKDHHNVSGLAFACSRCREDNKRRIYRRAA